MVLVHILVSSCLLLVYGAASTIVTGVNVTTALPITNLTDSWRDTLNSTTPSKIVQDPTAKNVSEIPQTNTTTTTTKMRLTAPIFMTPTPSPTTTPTSNTTEEDAYPTFYTSSPTVSWTSTPSTPSTPTPSASPTAFNPYPGYFLPTNSTSRPPPITLFPTSQNQSQNQNQNESRPLPTTTYIEMTPPPTPTPSIMSPSVTSPDVIETSTPSESFTMSAHDKTYFRLLFAIYLVVMTLLIIYIMKD